HPVAGEGIERMPEGRRPVFLEEKMPDPGEGIARYQRRQQPPRIAALDRQHDEADREAGADEVQAPAGAVAVLAEVIGIELAETRKPFAHRLASFSAAFARAQ